MKRAQAFGFSLEEIGDLLEGEDPAPSAAKSGPRRAASIA